MCFINFYFFFRQNKGDPRFNFLELSHQYHGYYAHKLTIYEGAVNPKVLTEEELLRKQEPQAEKQKKLEELHKKQQRMEEVRTCFINFTDLQKNLFLNNYL